MAMMERYKQHVIDQALTLLKAHEIKCLFTTPKLLEALCEKVSLKKVGITGVFCGGTEMTPQFHRFAVEELLDGIYFAPTYGNTLMGLATHKPRTKPDDPWDIIYFPPSPRAMIEVVDPDRPDRVVGYGETGRVRLTTLTKEFFMPRFLERDEAEREAPVRALPLGRRAQRAARSRASRPRWWRGCTECCTCPSFARAGPTRASSGRVPHFRSRETFVEVSQANPGLIRRDLLEESQWAMRESLAAFSSRDLIALSVRAARVFMEDTLPLGDASQAPDEYVRQLSATTGLPHVLVRRNMEKIRGRARGDGRRSWPASPATSTSTSSTRGWERRAGTR